MKPDHVNKPEKPEDIATQKSKGLALCILLVAVHSLALGTFIFFCTETFYTFFFRAEIENFFFVKQSGLFLFCLGLFYLIPLADLPRNHRAIGIIIITKVLAVIFLVINTYLTPRPGIILLAAAVDACMAALLVYLSFSAEIFIKKRLK